MDVIENEPFWSSRGCHENANLMRHGLKQLGYDTGNSVSAVIPVIVGEDLTAYQLARTLHALGIYVSPVAYPAVKRGHARLRVSVMATHTLEDILKALNAFEKARGLVPRISAPAPVLESSEPAETGNAAYQPAA